MVKRTKRKKRWRTVQLPEDLLSQVDRIIENRELGYTSRSEFIKEAVRLRIIELEEYLMRRALQQKSR
ncbi:MAG: ribbon-helix-helix protein, CopG family [Thermoprotei archaeon]|nr:ribbon-helix-helix protein, CopG family [Thermoprotei archaeon]